VLNFKLFSDSKNKVKNANYKDFYILESRISEQFFSIQLRLSFSGTNLFKRIIYKNNKEIYYVLVIILLF
jgi:hypothetical protein